MTITIKQAVQAEQILKRSFADVVINGSDKEPKVIAKGWNRPLNPSGHRVFYLVRGLIPPLR